MGLRLREQWLQQKHEGSEQCLSLGLTSPQTFLRGRAELVAGTVPLPAWSLLASC